MVEVSSVLIWIWIRMRQNDVDPLDPDPDPQHCWIVDIRAMLDIQLNTGYSAGCWKLLIICFFCSAVTGYYEEQFF